MKLPRRSASPPASLLSKRERNASGPHSTCQAPSRLPGAAQGSEEEPLGTTGLGATSSVHQELRVQDPAPPQAALGPMSS